MNAPATVSELIGIYNADGGLRGELRYVLGRWRGTAHCSLCDVTHGQVREREAFRSLRSSLPVPFTLLHRNELSAELHGAAADRTPCVFARTGGELVEIWTRPLSKLARVTSTCSITHCRQRWPNGTCTSRRNSVKVARAKRVRKTDR